MWVRVFNGENLQGNANTFEVSLSAIIINKINTSQTIVSEFN